MNTVHVVSTGCDIEVMHGNNEVANNMKRSHPIHLDPGESPRRELFTLLIILSWSVIPWNLPALPLISIQYLDYFHDGSACM